MIKNKTLQKPIRRKLFSIFMILILAMTVLPIASAEVPDKPDYIDAIAWGSDTIRIDWGYMNYANYGDEYSIYRSNSQDGTYIQIGRVQDTGYIDTNLDSGTTYYYRVAAHNEDGKGEWTEPVSATTDQLNVYNVAAYALSTSEIFVAWDAVPNAQSYSIYRSLDAHGTYVFVVTTPTTTFRDSGLASDTTYYYKVQVGDEYVSYGPLSDYATATTHRIQTLELSAISLSPSKIRLEWNTVPGATAYTVYRSTYNGGYTYIAQVVTTEFMDTGLEPSTPYWYKVIASNGPENITHAKTQDVLFLTATEIDTQSIQLDWTSSTNADQYKIYRSTSQNGPFEHVGTTPYTKTFIDMSLDHTTTYYYLVVTWNGYVEGNPSNIASATTKTPVIGVPDVEAEALNTSSIKVTWNEITGAFDYNIYRSLTEDGTYEKIGDTEDLEFVDKDLDHTTTYYYKVAVYTGQDMGEKSAPASATTKTPEKPTNPGNGGSGEVKVTGKSTKTIAPGFETPVENEVVQVDEVQAGAAGFVFPFFLILAVLTTGVLYVRAKKRQNKIE